MADPVIMGYSQGELLLVTGRLKEELADEIRMQGLEPSNIEVSAEKESRLLRTSRGVDVSEIGTKVFVEFTLLARDGNKVANYTVSTSARRLADIVPSELARKYGRYAWHSLGAQKPKAYTGRVVVMEDALKEMLATDSPFGGNPFDNHASGPLIFRGISILEIGKRICRERIEKRGVTILREKEIRGEPITLINDPLKPYGTMSKSFGIDGTPATRTVIIDKSVLQNVYTDKRHYDWLRLAKKGVACAGPKGNVAILPGKKSVRELLDGDEVVTVRAFSWYNPDPYSADFSSEIRLGSVIRNGVEYPIKGGLLVGNFFDMFTDIELSNETFEAGNYSGPVAMSVSNLKISG
jgi:predicted Zn-dependent protease